MYQNHLGSLLKTFAGPQHFCCSKSGWGSRICIPNKLPPPRNADAAGLGTVSKTLSRTRILLRSYLFIVPLLSTYYSVLGARCSLSTTRNNPEIKMCLTSFTPAEGRSRALTRPIKGQSSGMSASGAQCLPWPHLAILFRCLSSTPAPSTCIMLASLVFIK